MKEAVSDPVLTISAILSPPSSPSAFRLLASHDANPHYVASPRGVLDFVASWLAAVSNHEAAADAGNVRPVELVRERRRTGDIEGGTSHPLDGLET